MKISIAGIVDVEMEIERVDEFISRAEEPRCDILIRWAFDVIPPSVCPFYFFLLLLRVAGWTAERADLPFQSNHPHVDEMNEPPFNIHTRLFQMLNLLRLRLVKRVGGRERLQTIKPRLTPFTSAAGCCNRLNQWKHIHVKSCQNSLHHDDSTSVCNQWYNTDHIVGRIRKHPP